MSCGSMRIVSSLSLSLTITIIIMMMTMGSYVCCVVIVALVAAFTILLAKKVGIIEWYQIHGNDFVSKLASCDFCLSFWVGTLLAVAVAIVTGDIVCLTIGVMSCPITRMLV